MAVRCCMRIDRRVGYWKFFCAIVAIQLIFIVTFLLSFDGERPNNFDHQNGYVRTFESRVWKNSSKKIILAWTEFWFQHYWCDISMDKGEPSRCADRCDITIDKTRLQESDAVVFHHPDLLPWMTMPKTRTPDQAWVLYSLEPPPRQIWYMGGGFWKNVFNWTMTYRRDSTVFVRPYHGYEPLSQKEKIEVAKAQTNFLKEKSRMALATISDCYDVAERYKDVYSVQKYLDVDVYGHCGTKECPQWKPECEKLIREYKFQLAFENSYCDEYITEKYWEAHLRKVIPIVNWKFDPKGLVFPNSYINIFDFPDTKSLAEYMLEVANNETLYNSYFHWTKDFKMNCHCGCHWCVLCDALHDITRPAQTITDPYAWTKEDSCDIMSIANFVKRILKRWLFNIGLYSYDR